MAARDGDGWVKKNAGWKWTGAQYYDAKWVKKAITRLVLVETLGGIAPPTKQFLHVFAKEAAGSKTDRTEYGAASASASSFVVHHTQQISMAAVVGDAENISKQARNERKDWLNSSARANWVKNKQEANGFLPSYARPQWGVPAPPSSADGPLHPSRTDHVVPTIAVVGSLVM